MKMFKEKKEEWEYQKFSIEKFLSQSVKKFRAGIV